MSSEKRITRSSKAKNQMDLNKETPSNQEQKVENLDTKKKSGLKGLKVISHDITPPAKSKTPTIISKQGSRVLRSMSNGKSKIEEKNPNPKKTNPNSVKTNPNSEKKNPNSGTGEKVQSGKKRGRKESKSTQLSTIRNRVRSLVSRINYEQNLIDAYSTDGWKGQSLEKLRPEKELERAKAQIIKCKLKIRESFKQLETLLYEGKHDNSLFDSKGEIDCDDIFCAKCKLTNATLNNDIILCDGICDRGFHQNCLDPPLLTKDIPPGDVGWLCPACDCKVDCVELLNDSQGVHLTLGDSWEKVFPEAANGVVQLNSSDLPSDDSEDDDFNPDEPNGEENGDDNNGDDNNGDDDNEESSEDDSTSESDDPDLYTESSEDDKSSKKKMKKSDKREIDIEALPSEDSEDDDFKEEIGEDEEDSDSDDFSSDPDEFCKEIAKGLSGGDRMGEEEMEGGDGSVQRRRRQGSSESKGKALETNSNNSPKSTTRSTKSKRNSCGLDKNKTLKEYFETNQYPSRETREILAEELGLTIQQVGKWFAGARHYAKAKLRSTPDPQKSTSPKKLQLTPESQKPTTPKKLPLTPDPQNSNSSKKRGKPLKISTNSRAKIDGTIIKCDTTSEPTTPICVPKSDNDEKTPLGVASGGTSKGEVTPSLTDFMDSDRKKAILRELRKQKMGR